MKKQELQQRISLLMNYDLKKTLNENKVNIGIISEEELDEVNIAKIGGESVELLAKAIEDGLKAGVRDVEIIGKDGAKTKAASTFDVIEAAKKGKLTAEGLGKVYEGLLRSKLTPVNVVDSIISSNEFAPAFNKRWQNYLSKPDVLTTKLRGEGYSDEVIQKMLNKSRGGNITKLGDVAAGVEAATKSAEAAAAEAKSITINNNGVMTIIDGKGNTVNTNLAQDASKAEQNFAEVKKGGKKKIKGKDYDTTPPPEDEKIIDENNKNRKKRKPIPPEVTNKLNNKWKWALGILGGGALAYWIYFKSKNERVPQLNDCVMGLVDAGIGKYVPGVGGALAVYVEKTGNDEWDKAGGLYFYMGNPARVVSKDNKLRGTWTCKNGAPAAQMGATPPTGTPEIGGADAAAQSTNEQLNEQVANDLNNDVNKMIDLLDFPVTKQDLKDAVTLLKKYYGTGQAKTFLDRYQKSGLGGGDLLKTLNWIYTSNPESVENKDTLMRMYQEMRDSKDLQKGGTLTDYVDITWDGGAPNPNPNPNPNPDPNPNPNPTPKPDEVQYHDCSSKDLEKGDKLEIGCIHPSIKKLQECLISNGADLGPNGADGKFGPKLSGVLAGKTEIDKAIYDSYTAKCRTASVTGSTTGTTVTSGTTSGDTTNPPLHHDDVISGGTGNAPVEQPLNIVHPSEPEVTGEQLFRKWVGTYFRNKFGGKRQAIGQNRLFYKGPDLTQADFDKLNGYLVKNGYQITNDKHAKRYGDKYVWYLNGADQEGEETATSDAGSTNQTTAAEPQQISENLIKNIVSKHLRSKL
jgi:hypothetical protein